MTTDNARLNTRVANLDQANQAKHEQIGEQLLLIASLQEGTDSLRTLRAQLEADVGKLAFELDANIAELEVERDRSKALEKNWQSRSRTRCWRNKNWKIAKSGFRYCRRCWPNATRR